MTEPSLPEPHPNQKHGLHSKKAIVRALLPDDEAEAWDLAPVPSDCPEALEEVFREYFVMKFRVHKWESGIERPSTATEVQALAQRLRLLHIPLRGLLKSVEVHARLKEAEQTADMGDAVLAYLRTLPDHQLGQFMFEGEAPRFDPATQVLLPAPDPVNSALPREGADEGSVADPGEVPRETLDSGWWPCESCGEEIDRGRRCRDCADGDLE